MRKAALGAKAALVAALLVSCGVALSGKDDSGAGDGIGTGDDDGDGGGDGGGDEPPPEDEDEGDFRVPRASGKYVYSASETTNSVAVIDTDTLGIEVVDVGAGPTVVRSLPDRPAGAGAVAVLCQGSEEVALLRTDAAAGTTVALHPVTPGANNVAVSRDGEYAIVYHDVDGPEELGPGSDQEITVVETDGGATHEMTVGAHPRDVVFSTDGERAYVITAAGVNIIEFAGLDMVGKPLVIPVVEDPATDPDTVEVRVSTAEDVALARVEGSARIVATDLVSFDQFAFDLPLIPTDLDVSANGDFAILTMPHAGGSAFAEIALPVGASSSAVLHPVDGEYVGLSQIAPDGERMILFTTQNPFGDWGCFGARDAGGTTTGTGSVTGTGTGTGSVTGGGTGGTTMTGGGTTSTGTGMTGTGTGTGIPTGTGTGTGTGTTTTTSSSCTQTGDPPPDPRERITVAKRDGGGDWGTLVPVFAEIPVRTIGIAPDSATAVLVHTDDPAPDPEAPWAYTLLDLVKSTPVTKLQRVEADAGPILFTPSGDRAAVLLRDDPLAVRRVDWIDMRTLIVDQILLGSPPEGGGFVDVTRKLFISQEHPTGRITFIDHDGNIQTITGFRLNDAVKD